MVEISRSRIISITNYSVRTYTYVYVRASPAAICIESDDDVVEPEVEKEKTQSSIEGLPDKFRHLGHGPRCDSDGLGPNGP